MANRWEEEIAATRCWECGEPLLPDEATLPASEPGWRVHAEGCSDTCVGCGDRLDGGRWPGELCWPCYDPARARRP